MKRKINDTKSPEKVKSFFGTFLVVFKGEGIDE